MVIYPWTAAYLAVLEEHDRIRLQQAILKARSEIDTRHSELTVAGFMRDRDLDEFHHLCHARRTLDLLKQVSQSSQAAPSESPEQSWPLEAFVRSLPAIETKQMRRGTRSDADLKR